MLKVDPVARNAALLRLLIVDDDAFIRSGLRLYLESQGFDIQEAGDEETAWQLASLVLPDAATIDISLPPNPYTAKWPDNYPGIQLARWLKEAYPTFLSGAGSAANSIVTAPQTPQGG